MKKYFLISILLTLSLLVFAADKNVSKVSEKFYKAVGDADIKLAQQYLSEGADINAKAGSFGWTPLMKIVFGKSDKAKMEMFKFLIENKADINIKNDFNQTAFYIATGSDTRLEELKILLSLGSDINAQTETMATPLYNAALWLNKAVVEFLISKKADVNIKNKDGNTALMVACKDKNGAQVVDLLIKAKADVNVKNNKGETALSFAKKKGSKEIVDLLINAGAKE